MFLLAAIFCLPGGRPGRFLFNEPPHIESKRPLNLDSRGEMRDSWPRILTRIVRRWTRTRILHHTDSLLATGELSAELEGISAEDEHARSVRSESGRTALLHGIRQPPHQRVLASGRHRRKLFDTYSVVTSKPKNFSFGFGSLHYAVRMSRSSFEMFRERTL